METTYNVGDTVIVTYSGVAYRAVVTASDGARVRGDILDAPPCTFRLNLSLSSNRRVIRHAND